MFNLLKYFWGVFFKPKPAPLVLETLLENTPQNRALLDAEWEISLAPFVAKDSLRSIDRNLRTNNRLSHRFRTRYNIQPPFPEEPFAFIIWDNEADKHVSYSKFRFQYPGVDPLQILLGRLKAQDDYTKWHQVYLEVLGERANKERGDGR